MRLAAILFIAMLFAFAPAAMAVEEDEEDGHDAAGKGGVSYSYYLISCGSYMQHRERGMPTDANNTADTFYVAGWLSAYNRVRANNAIPEDTTLDDVMLWLEDYCTDHPLSNLETGLFALSEEVKPRKPTPPPTPKPQVQPYKPAPVPAPAPAFHAPVEGLKPLSY